MRCGGAGSLDPWPDAAALMGAVRAALRGDIGACEHPVLSKVHELAKMYRDHVEAARRCDAPPAVLGYSSAVAGLSQTDTAARGFISAFDALACQTLPVGQTQPGLLAARVVYWAVNADAHTCNDVVEACKAYDDWRACHIQAAEAHRSTTLCS